MKRRGTNQFKRRTTIDFLGVSTRTFVYYIVLVIFLILLFQICRLGQINPSHFRVLQAHAQVVDYKLPELASPQTQEQVKAMIRKVWGKDASIGIAIARCESGYRPNALNYNTNGTIDEGIFQINSVHKMPDMQNPTANVLYGYRMFQDQGTNPWYSSQSCWEGSI